MDIKIQDTNYYVVHGWMINQLGLKGNALALYAIIYGFSQTTNQKCTASQKYLSEWLGCDERTIRRLLNTLLEDGLITRSSITKGNITYNSYEAILPQDKMSGTTGQNVRYTQDKMSSNNIDNKKEKKTLSTIEGAKPSHNKSIYEEIYSNPEYKSILEALKTWEKYCKDIKRGYKRDTFAKWAKFLSDKSKDNPEIALAIVNQSIKSGWKELYELKNGAKFNSVSKPFDKDTAQLADVAY